MVGSSESNCALATAGSARTTPITCCAIARTRARSSPETRNWTGKPTGGPFSSRDTRPRSAGKSSSKSWTRRVAQPLALLVALRDEHELREVRALQLLVERQVEARAADADVGDIAVDARPRRRGSTPSSSPRRASPRTSCLRAAASRRSARAATTTGRTAAGRNGTRPSPRRTRASVAPITTKRCATLQSTSARKRR